MGFNDYSFNDVPCPCQHCSNRSAECHGSCKRYAAYRKGCDEFKKTEAYVKTLSRLGEPIYASRSPRRR